MFRLDRAPVLAALVALAASTGLAEASVLLLDARCVDVAARALRPASVWIEDGVVRALGAPDGSDLGVGVDVPRLDLGGAHLVPGLVDLRVHGDVQRSPGHRDSLGVDGARRLALAAGVVAVLDVFGERSDLDDDGALWFGGAPLLVARGAPEAAFPGARPVDSPGMARSLLEARADRTLPIQVVYDGRRALALGPDTLEALVDARGGRAVAVQVVDWVDVRVALARGVDWFAQIPPGPVPDDVRAVLLERGAALAWTPQVALGLDFAAFAQIDSLRQDPGLARVLPDTMRDDYARVRLPQPRLGEMQVRARDLEAVFALFSAAGTTLRAGSGAGAVGTALGFSLVRELEWWVELGVEPWTALRGATVEAGGVLDRASGFAPGAPADFVVVDASPIDDMASLRAPTHVIRGGRVVDPVALAASVVHRPFQELPENPIPGGGRIPLVVYFGLGFVGLLLLRRAIKRAAARALEEDPSTD